MTQERLRASFRKARQLESLLNFDKKLIPTRIIKGTAVTAELPSK